MTIDVWLTYLDNNYASFTCNEDNDLTSITKKYALKNYARKDYHKALQDYIIDANLGEYDTIRLHFPTPRADEYLKLND